MVRMLSILGNKDTTNKETKIKESLSTKIAPFLLSYSLIKVMI